MRLLLFLLVAFIAIGVQANDVKPVEKPSGKPVNDIKPVEKPSGKPDIKSDDKPPAPSATGRNLPSNCVDQCFKPSGKFYSCDTNDFPCICTKDRRFIDEYADKIAPCVKVRDPMKCTEGGLESFMDAFQDICAQVGNPITHYPDDIKTWIDTALFTKYTVTHSDSTSESTPTSSKVSTVTQGSGTIASASSDPAQPAPASVSDTTVVKTENGKPTTVVLSASATSGVHTADEEGKNAGMTPGKKIAMGVGVTIAVLLLPIAGALIMFLRRRRKAAKISAAADEPPPVPVKMPQMSENPPPYSNEIAMPSELDGGAQLKIGEGAGPSELDGADANATFSPVRASVMSFELADTSVTPTMVAHPSGSQAQGVEGGAGENGFAFELDDTPSSPPEVPRSSA
ncbi:hypothetical protein P280DRAFT_480642 [Massarina eburnea CBS 473.64]|uniref:CFEM domain-containing protein n=1 Tax=Massarina eburnea CBS 473.64 TaxID=1395130 RepID=A0A6A6S1Q4_9PLEO|nr:hypothetical protein P280DRAFT_480642 [Massarina eburnea CBS 473.64]